MYAKGCKKNTYAAMGIGSMIIFISIIFVAGIAATVLVQTSTELERQTLETGDETVSDVASGLKLEGVEGQNQSGKITKIAIEISTKAGSPDIDLATSLIEISDGNYKIVLEAGNSSAFVSSANLNGDIFGNGNFGTATTFGINVLQDADGSCTSTTPIINFGDHVFLGVDVSSVFSDDSGLLPRTDVFGLVLCEEGSPAIIGFTTPSAYSDSLIELD